MKRFFDDVYIAWWVMVITWRRIKVCGKGIILAVKLMPSEIRDYCYADRHYK